MKTSFIIYTLTLLVLVNSRIVKRTLDDDKLLDQEELFFNGLDSDDLFSKNFDQFDIFDDETSDYSDIIGTNDDYMSLRADDDQNTEKASISNSEVGISMAEFIIKLENIPEGDIANCTIRYDVAGNTGPLKNEVYKENCKDKDSFLIKENLEGGKQYTFILDIKKTDESKVSSLKLREKIPKLPTKTNSTYDGEVVHYDVEFDGKINPSNCGIIKAESEADIASQDFEKCVKVDQERKTKFFRQLKNIMFAKLMREDGVSEPVDSIYNTENCNCSNSKLEVSDPKDYKFYLVDGLKNKLFELNMTSTGETEGNTSDGLSGGEIAGIVIGVLVLVAIIGVVGFIGYTKLNKD